MEHIDLMYKAQEFVREKLADGKVIDELDARAARSRCHVGRTGEAGNLDERSHSCFLGHLRPCSEAANKQNRVRQPLQGPTTSS